MQIRIALWTVVAAYASTVSAEYTKFFNQCTSLVYLWSTNLSATSQTYTLVVGTGNYSEAYQTLPYRGVALKRSPDGDVSALYNGSALTQDQYSLGGSLVWDSLVDTGGDPFWRFHVTLLPSGSGQSIDWPNGQVPSQALSTDLPSNLTLTLCASCGDISG